jgi:NitT/TauT family transport system substrate-binding protein
MTRWQKYLAVLLLMAFSVGVQVASAEDKVSLRLNYILYGFHTPFYLGQELGFYKAEGIDLTINEGQGSVRSVQLIAAKTDTFAIADSGSIMHGVSRGAPARTVMGLTNTSPFSVITLAENNIKTIKDLEGKKVAAAAGEAMVQLFPAVARANQLDVSKISMVMVDGAAKPLLVMERKADALFGGLDSEALVVESKGFKTVTFPFASLGVNTVGLTVLAHPDTLRDQPDMVRRFLKASVRAWETALKDPKAAVEAGMRAKAGLDRDLMLRQLTVGFGLMESANTKGLGVGVSSKADWDQTLELMKTYRDLKTELPSTAFFTNDFLPKR